MEPKPQENGENSGVTNREQKKYNTSRSLL